MELEPTDILTKLGQSQASIDNILRQNQEPNQRATLLAQMCRTLLPAAPLHACILQGVDRTFASVLDEAGNHRPEWAEQLQKELSKPPRPEGAKSRKLNGQEVAVEDLRFREHCHGWLALGLHGPEVSEIKIVVRTLLALCSRQLALHLELEQTEREREACELDRESLAWLANIGELASPVSHEVNNFLNATLLHVAVLGMQVPEHLRHDLLEIRRQGTNMAGMVKQLQQYRRQHQPAPQFVDLNRVVTETVSELCRKPPEYGSGFPIRLLLLPPTGALTLPDPPLAVPVRLRLAAHLPPVLGLPTDLKRLCSFLLTNAVGAVAAGGGGEIAIHTEAAENTVVLRLTDTGPSLAPDQLPHFFEPETQGREGTDRLELAACRNLVRRFQGTIQARQELEHGISVLVELPIGQPQ